MKSLKNKLTTSFLETLETTEINKIISDTKVENKDIEEIIIKYLEIKKKINLIMNKTG